MTGTIGHSVSSRSNSRARIGVRPSSADAERDAEKERSSEFIVKAMLTIAV